MYRRWAVVVVFRRQHRPDAECIGHHHGRRHHPPFFHHCIEVCAPNVHTCTGMRVHMYVHTYTPWQSDAPVAPQAGAVYGAQGALRPSPEPKSGGSGWPTRRRAPRGRLHGVRAPRCLSSTPQAQPREGHLQEVRIPWAQARQLRPRTTGTMRGQASAGEVSDLFGGGPQRGGWLTGGCSVSACAVTNVFSRLSCAYECQNAVRFL